MISNPCRKAGIFYEYLFYFHIFKKRWKSSKRNLWRFLIMKNKILSLILCISCVFSFFSLAGCGEKESAQVYFLNLGF